MSGLSLVAQSIASRMTASAAAPLNSWPTGATARRDRRPQSSLCCPSRTVLEEVRLQLDERTSTMVLGFAGSSPPRSRSKLRRCHADELTVAPRVRSTDRRKNSTSSWCFCLNAPRAHEGVRPTRSKVHERVGPELEVMHRHHEWSLDWSESGTQQGARMVCRNLIKATKRCRNIKTCSNSSTLNSSCIFLKAKVSHDAPEPRKLHKTKA